MEPGDSGGFAFFASFDGFERPRAAPAEICGLEGRATPERAKSPAFALADSLVFGSDGVIPIRA